MNFVNLKDFSNPVKPVRMRHSANKLRAEVGVSVGRYKNSANFRLNVSIGADILSKLQWQIGDKIQFMISKDSHQLALVTGLPGWALTSNRSMGDSPSYATVTFPSDFLGRELVRKFPKETVPHKVFGNTLVIDIKAINMKAS